MKTSPHLSRLVVALAATAALAGCSGMSRQDKATVGGAAIGGVAGSVLTDGSTAGTLGGAAVGGLIGRETQKKR